jgi:hypothetical protein
MLDGWQDACKIDQHLRMHNTSIAIGCKRRVKMIDGERGF